jgi:hypothetical protein
MLQSSQELRDHYGEPDVERFTAHPGISLAVEYGSDHLVCQALIEPSQTLIHGEEPVALMSSEAVTEILDDIVPPDVRGKQIGKSITSSGCNDFEILEYEGVSITRSTHNCLPLKPEREMRATVVFKREACRNLSNR